MADSLAERVCLSALRELRRQAGGRAEAPLGLPRLRQADLAVEIKTGKRKMIEFLLSPLMRMTNEAGKER